MDICSQLEVKTPMEFPRLPPESGWRCDAQGQIFSVPGPCLILVRGSSYVAYKCLRVAGKITVWESLDM